MLSLYLGRPNQQQQYAYQQPTYGGSSSQLFDDTSQYGDPSVGQQQDQMPQQPTFPGSQFVNDPMANMALQYGTSLASTGREFVDQKVFFSSKLDTFSL